MKGDPSKTRNYLLKGGPLVCSAGFPPLGGCSRNPSEKRENKSPKYCWSSKQKSFIYCSLMILIPPHI